MTDGADDRPRTVVRRARRSSEGPERTEGTDPAQHSDTTQHSEATQQEGDPDRAGAPRPGAAGEGERPSLQLGRAMWSVGGIAFGLRAIWVFLFVRVPGGDLLSDPFLYNAYALRFAAGRGYVSMVDLPTSYYPPGYPAFLGALYRLIDALGLESQRGVLVGLTQALLWAVAAIAVGLTARWAFRSNRVGVAAGLVLACWPNLITYASAWLSESLFVFLFAIGVAAITFTVRAPAGDRRRIGSVAIAAICFALATMVRPQVLIGLPLLALAWLVGGIGWRRTLALAAAVGVAVAALVVPWSIRNEAVLGERVFISTNGGDNLCVGYHPRARGGFAIPPYCDTGETRIDGVDAELRRNAQTRQLAIDYIRSEPQTLPWLAVKKLYWTFRTDDDGLRGNELYRDEDLMPQPWRAVWWVFTNTAYAAIMLGALGGVVVAAPRAWRERDPAVLGLLAFTLAGVMVPMVFFGDPRFKVPTTPLFAAFAALALTMLYDRFRGTGEQLDEPLSDRPS
ncbi:MAG: hypothetical protein ACK5O2_03960 [Microthrixaceae bacterium]